METSFTFRLPTELVRWSTDKAEILIWKKTKINYFNFTFNFFSFLVKSLGIVVVFENALVKTQKGQSLEASMRSLVKLRVLCSTPSI